MTPKLADYIEAGKALDADEREIAALALQHVDEMEQAEIDAAWSANRCRGAMLWSSLVEFRRVWSSFVE